MILDQERVTRLIGSLRSSVRLLSELSAIPEAEFIRDAHKLSSAKYNFIAAIEAIIDLGSHWVSRARLGLPKDYADVFEVLKQAGQLDTVLADDLKRMARFRNRLVHLYWDVDPGELYSILQRKLSDFDRFLACLASSPTATENSDSE